MTNEVLRIDATTETHHRRAFQMNNSLAERPHHAPLSRWLTMLLTPAGMPIPLTTSAHAATTPKAITNHCITPAVERALIFEKGVFPSSVDVNTSEGIVTPSGVVSNLLAKERAVKIAESIRGVRGAINQSTQSTHSTQSTQSTVTPVPRPDADIPKHILAALRQDPA